MEKTNWMILSPEQVDISSSVQSARNTHLKYAPDEVLMIWDAITSKLRPRIAVTDISNKEQLQEVEKHLEDCFTGLLDSFAQVSPRAATSLLYLERTEPFTYFDKMQFFSPAKCAWLIGVFGHGSMDDSRSARRVFAKYARWEATYLIHHQISMLLNYETARPVTLSDRIVANRMLNIETRMPWISSEIIEFLGNWVDRNLPSFQTEFGSNVLNTINKNAENATAYGKEVKKGKKIPTSTFSKRLLRNMPDSTLRRLTAQHKPITRILLKESLEGVESEVKPIVDIDDEPTVLNRSTWLTSRESCLINAVMTLCPRNIKEGRPFEEITCNLLNKWGPSNLEWESGQTITSPNRTNTDELDLLASSNNVTFIGECKANRPPSKNTSIDLNFEANILNKAVSQITQRVNHWDFGWRVSNTSSNNTKAKGFIVTYYSYAGAPWLSSSLKNENGDIERIPIFPLHCLILASAIMKKDEDLSNYLAYRSTILRQGLMSFDELEILLGFINNVGSVPFSTTDCGNAIFRQYELDDAGYMIDARKYRDTISWKERLTDEISKHSKPVTPPLPTR